MRVTICELPEDRGQFMEAWAGLTAHIREEKSELLVLPEIWQVPKSNDYPEGIKFRAWFSEKGQAIFGLDNHKPKGPHLHVGSSEVAYVFRGVDTLMEDVLAMIRNEGFEI